MLDDQRAERRACHSKPITVAADHAHVATGIVVPAHGAVVRQMAPHGLTARFRRSATLRPFRGGLAIVATLAAPPLLAGTIPKRLAEGSFRCAQEEARNDGVRGFGTATSGARCKGDMEFNATPLRDVASAMNDRTGARILIAPSLSGLVFTGNIKVLPGMRANAYHLAQLIGAKVEQEGTAWRLTPGDGIP